MKTLLMMLLAVSSAAAQSKPAPQQGPPPKNLSQHADGRYSANSDPANPEKFEVYIVKTGDTLSSIAGQVLKNTRLWPQLWEQNDHIINPHWIYPNDKVLIKPITLITDAAAPAAEPEAEPESRKPLAIPPSLQTQAAPPAGSRQPALFDMTASKPAPEVKASDMYCSGFIRTAAVSKDTKVIAKFNSSAGALATSGDYLYINHGAEAGAKVGAMYQVVRPTRKVSGKDGNLGTHYLDVAQVQVVMAQPEVSLVRVNMSCEAIELGDLMLPAQTSNAPTIARPRNFSPFMKTAGGLSGSVVISRTVLENFGSSFKASGILPGAGAKHLSDVEKGVAALGSIVYIDRGQNAGVKPGDVFIVYRPIEMDSRLYGKQTDEANVAGEKMAIGELVVLKVEERAATALVTYSSTGISAGDSVERR
jgi:hypothetical protein